MNRFLAHPRLAVAFGEWLRCTCGFLGCTAMAGAISIGAAVPSDAATGTEPEPRRPVPPVCRHAVGDRYTAHQCKEAWVAMYERSRRRSAHGREFPRWGDRYDRKPKEHKVASPHPRENPAPHAATPGRPKSARPSPTPSPSTSKRTPAASAPARAREQADEVDSRPSSLQPVLLLGLLLPAAAAMCYPFRHRIYNAATAGASPVPAPDARTPRAARFTYRPALNPFASPAAGLRGPGATSTARVLALTALDVHGDDSLVVVPRPDAITLFGLAEDELLDDDTAGLFIPGNLDAALAYLETELAIREKSGASQGRRLLLVADCAQEAERITALLTHHPDAVFAILLGHWTGDQATIDDEGLVEAPPPVASNFPPRLPAMSRTEARDRLLEIVDQHKDSQKPPSRRRSTSRRG